MKRHCQKTYGVSDRQIEIMDATLEGKDVSDKKLYLQITYLKPYLTDEERRTRTTPFERNTNLTTFQFQVRCILLSLANDRIHAQGMLTSVRME
jgi:hypothetical protein